MAKKYQVEEDNGVVRDATPDEIAEYEAYQESRTMTDAEFEKTQQIADSITFCDTFDYSVTYKSGNVNLYWNVNSPSVIETDCDTFLLIMDSKGLVLQVSMDNIESVARIDGGA